MSDIVIKTENLGKKYVIGHQAERGGYTALRDVLMQNARTLWNKTKDLATGKPIIHGDTMEEVWALKDVSFEIRRGEAVGIIGRNGAGKSTLLKILSRITEPSTGRVTIKGRVASLLEVGTGFHPELSGRENIYLNGTILGMTRVEIRQKFDEIVAFAEVEKYLDTPVKRYSSGMYVRLAFAVAAHLEPEILLVDEVLAVGDAAFQKKCLGKIGDIGRDGRTVLFVSHNMGAVQALCTKCILFESGIISKFDKTSLVLDQYLLIGHDKNNCVFLPIIESDAFFISVSICDSNEKLSTYLDIRAPVTILFHYSVKQPIRDLEISFAVYNKMGVKVFTSFQNRCNLDYSGFHASGEFIGEITIPRLFLTPGHYTITAGIHQPNIHLYDLKEDVIGFHVVESGSKQYAYSGTDIGAVLVDFPWRVRHLKTNNDFHKN
jgi:lipopolysaccharide transport system ATP-binding protein